MPKQTRLKPKRTREQLVKLSGDTLLTTAEVATLLDLSPNTIAHWRISRTPVLPWRRCGLAKCRYLKRDVDLYLENALAESRCD